MKSRVLVVGMLVLLAGLWIYLRGKPAAMPGHAAGPDQVSQAAAISNALARQDSKTVAVIASNFAQVPPPATERAELSAPVSAAATGEPATLQFTNFAPSIVLENMRRAIRQYGDMFGGNPIGTNPEITSQLSGNNPRHINFINAEAGMRINANGELVDAWGTPYFFHQLSKTVMEIHSAGPDQTMWTSDDLVVQ